MKRIALMAVLLAGIFVSVSGQNKDEGRAGEKFVEQLREFESVWLAASLNQDKTWLERFFAGKLVVVPSEIEAVRNRTQETAELIDRRLKPEEIKVRITGNITVMTNNPPETADADRAYYFLDTFNRRGGKWQVIASHSSIVRAGEIGDAERRQIEQQLIKTENERAQIFLSRDCPALEGILAADFVGVDEKGFLNKAQEIAACKESADKITSAASANVKVNVYTNETAVVTGEAIERGLDAGGREINRRRRFTSTYVRRNAVWQAVASQSTAIK